MGIDTKMWRELCDNTITPHTIPFDSDSKNTKLFFNQLTRLAEIFGWNLE